MVDLRNPFGTSCSARGEGRSRDGESSQGGGSEPSNPRVVHEMEVEKEQPKINPALAPVPGFEHIIFVDPKHRVIFLDLMDMPITATRFCYANDLRRMNIGERVQGVLQGTGLGFLYTCLKPTFADITLEFLSSFCLHPHNANVSFRTCNTPFNLTLNEFGALFGMLEGCFTLPPPDYNINILWCSITGSTRVNVSQLCGNTIQVPELRLWQRLVAGTVFGRDATNISNKPEMSVLGAYLNVQRLPNYYMNVAYLMATHFKRVAQGHLSTIEIGGLVTHIAQNRIKRFRYKGRQHRVSQEIPVLDIEQLTKIHKWVRIERRVFEWRIEGDKWIPIDSTAIPVVAPTPQLPKVLSFGHLATWCPTFLMLPGFRTRGPRMNLMRRRTRVTPLGLSRTRALAPLTQHLPHLRYHHSFLHSSHLASSHITHHHNRRGKV